MCGIVGAVAQRDVKGILLEGLKRLEYRGYDSAGMALFNSEKESIIRRRAKGKVKALEAKLDDSEMAGLVGISHTRWATHGKPNIENAHPHTSGDNVALVHNGIIENYNQLRTNLKEQGYVFTSETDSEVIAHLLSHHYDKQQDFLSAVQSTLTLLDGAYALAIMHREYPDCLIGARQGSPLVVGVGIDEYYLASDQLALLPVTDRFIFLEEGDVVLIKKNQLSIYDNNGDIVKRKVVRFEHKIDSVDRGEYRHFMLKEIFEQPLAIRKTLEGRISAERVLDKAFGVEAKSLFGKVQNIQIIACGTSYHAGMVARYWFESLAGIPCQVEIASEFRYRKHTVANNTLFVTLSQSGETADTLAALRLSKNESYLGSLCICNVPGSSLVRESDLSLMTLAGPEIGVASTKAFTTQLIALLLLVVSIGKQNKLTDEQEAQIVSGLHQLDHQLPKVLGLAEQIEALAEQFAEKQNALFLGRGIEYPIALEGALKLKEISYIHAEAYPAGELKHGPLALVDSEMPIIAVAPSNELTDKLVSNLEEVKARGGVLYLFAGENVELVEDDNVTVIRVPLTGNIANEVFSPIIYVIPLQLLSYYVAVIKGTDVDQPRNLAKSVTVE